SGPSCRLNSIAGRYPNVSEPPAKQMVTSLISAAIGAGFVWPNTQRWEELKRCMPYFGLDDWLAKDRRCNCRLGFSQARRRRHHSLTGPPMANRRRTEKKSPPEGGAG